MGNFTSSGQDIFRFTEKKQDFSAGWRFCLGAGEEARRPDFDDSAWRTLDLPHDWSIEQPFDKDSPGGWAAGYLDGGLGWYRKRFTPPQHMKGKKIFLRFDGAYMNSTVYLNGRELGVHHYGYTPFEFDLTPFLDFDNSNCLVVRVQHRQPSSRWYSGSGINRYVSLIAVNPVHIPSYGVFVTTPDISDTGSRKAACLTVATRIRNDSTDEETVTLTSTVFDETGKSVASVCSSQAAVGGETTEFSQTAQIPDARLWSPGSPVIYQLESRVAVGGRTTDVCQTPFGIRGIRIDPDCGFFLNGLSFKLRGVCLHPDDEGCLGHLASRDAIQRKLRLLRDMGCNAIRTAHNPPSPEFMEECDRLGFLVMEEAFDSWEMTKTENDYHLYFAQDAKEDIQTMVDRDKNHPCVVLWSIGNEIPDTRTENGVRAARNLAGWIREIDRTRPVAIAENNTDDRLKDPHVEEVASFLDAQGFNYAESLYDYMHEAHPGRCFFGSEVTSAIRSRGIYKTPLDQNIPATPDHQCSSYDNSVVEWGSRAEISWILDRDRPYLLGTFVWTGFDYLGEPYPYDWPSRSSYFGILDTAGIPKDVYYFYQSQWTAVPMVHLFPVWKAQEGQIIPIMVYTNARSVELLLNGKSLGEKQMDPNGLILHLVWEVPFQEGRLQAIGRDEKGNVVAREETMTPGRAAKISLSPNKIAIPSDGKALVYIVASVEDENKNFVPDADDLIQFCVSGGQIVGVDNGDATDLSPYKSFFKKAFRGKCLVIVQADTSEGDMKVSASSGTLPNGSSTVHIKKKAG